MSYHNTIVLVCFCSGASYVFQSGPYEWCCITCQVLGLEVYTTTRDLLSYMDLTTSFSTGKQRIFEVNKGDPSAECYLKSFSFFVLYNQDPATSGSWGED